MCEKHSEHCDEVFYVKVKAFQEQFLTSLKFEICKLNGAWKVSVNSNQKSKNYFQKC